jgi:sugar phosphate isomerase/epimerase
VKLALIGDEASQDLGVALALVRAHGFHGIEIRSVWDTPPHLLAADQCRRIREQVEAAGVELVAYDSPVFKQPLPRTRREHEAALRLLETSLEVARALGSPPMRIFSFYREGPPRPEPAAEAMAALLDQVACADVPLLVENGTRSNSPTASALAELLGLLAPRPLGALWDPGNAAFSGLEQASPLQAREALGPHLRLVHVKDPRGTGHYTRLGRGDLPWAAIAAGLRADGFDGFLSLETHWRLGSALTPALRDEPWGAAFSRGGRRPTSVCMATLRDLAAAPGVPSRATSEGARD